VTCSLAVSACFVKNMYLSFISVTTLGLVGFPGERCFSPSIISFTWTKSGEEWWKPISASRGFHVTLKPIDSVEFDSINRTRVCLLHH
jgi:hypothetical protein